MMLPATRTGTAPNRYDLGEDFVDYNYNGSWNKSTGFLQPGTYLDGSEYRLFDNTVTKLKGNYTNQINRFHMIKTGFEFTMNNLDYYKLMNPWFFYDTDQFETSEDDIYPDRGEQKTVYKYEPKEFSAFVQDKMEFEDLVVNAGVRLDMRILDDKSVDYYEERYDAGEFGYEEEINKYTYAVSPRFGISHSISETSKLFFSYGHLYQLPNYTLVYDPNTKAGRNPLFGNMNLDYERNVQYELGVVNEVGEYLIDVTGYFKDIYDMINTKTYEYGITNATVYYNSDYGKSRGVEISVDKSLSNHYLWGLSYTLSYAYGKSSSATSNFDDNDKLVVKEYPLDWDERHTLNTYLTLYGEKARLCSTCLILMTGHCLSQQISEAVNRSLRTKITTTEKSLRRISRRTQKECRGLPTQILSCPRISALPVKTRLTTEDLNSNSMFTICSTRSTRSRFIQIPVRGTREANTTTKIHLKPDRI
jgi:outer membrane receptor protein involved in Fe transport